MSSLSVRERVAAVPRETGLVVGLISGSQFFNHAFLVLLPPIFTVLEGDLGVSIAMLGTVLGVQALVNTVCTVPYGYLADHYDRTLALGLSSVIGATGAIVTALAPGLWTLLAGQVLIGIGVGGHHPAHYPLLTDATNEDAHGRAFAVYRRSRRLPRGLTPGLKPTASYCLNLYSSVWVRWNAIRNCDNGVSSRSQKKSERVLIWKKATS